MEYYNNTLCIEAGWLIEQNILSKHNFDKMKSRKQLRVVRRACLNNPALVAYDSIPEKYKLTVKNIIGDDPHKVAQKSVLAQMIEPDEQARIFFDAYIDTNGNHLSEKLKEEYCANAAVFNAVHYIANNRPAQNRTIGSSKGLWPKLAEAVLKLDKTKFKHTLNVSNSRRFRERYLKYISNDESKYGRVGYESLIHGNLANKNSEKINDEAKVWLLSRWTSMVNRIATTQQLFDEYNALAESQNWKKLRTPDTVHHFLFSEDIKPVWWAARYGEQKFKEKFAYQNKTILPTMRDSLWYSDGTKLNYYYQYRDENGHFKIGTTQVYEVMDVYSECLLGYFISDSEDYKAQYNAYRMAIQFSEHKPYQITYDNQGGHKKLESGDFLTRLAHLGIKTKPYNGKSKTIENAFFRFQAQVLKKDWFFTGQNIQSKKEESKANHEFIMANKHSLPTLDEVKATYKKRREEWMNNKHPKQEVSRVEAYSTSENPKSTKVDLIDMVDLFWVLREKPVKCSAYGINFEHNKEKLHYMVMLSSGLPDIKWLARNIDKKFRIKFDPNDRSMIYLYEETPQGLRFICEAVEDIPIHRGKQEQEDWEMKRWNAIDKAITDMREEFRDELMEMQRQHNELPEQHGLKTPGIKGINRKKKKKKGKTEPADNFGKLQKAMSNVVVQGDDEDFNEDELYNLM